MARFMFVFLMIWTVCATIAMTSQTFSVGSCAVLNQQPGARFDPTNIVRIEGYSHGTYQYRWWCLQHEWALDVSSQLGRQEVFERNFHPAKCP